MITTQITANEILNSLMSRRFKVVYQPKFDMKAEQISGMEALLRWNTVQKDAASTETVIAVAEEYDIITSLTLFVVEKVCQDMSEWQEKKCR
jgi:EAL domain-containing protein (putative c-di-GMP-specific phosphodiesterase class I)